MRSRAIFLSLLAMGGVPCALATPVSFWFVAASGASSGGQISFSGGATNASAGTSTFTFLNATCGGAGSGYTFDITSASGETSLNGLFGLIGGTWTIDAVTSNSGTDTASVTQGNPGTFRVYQDPSDYVEGHISFFCTKAFLSGQGGGVSGNGTLNVSGWTTNGSITNSGFQDLISQSTGKSSISFTFAPIQTLTQLVTAADSNLDVYVAHVVESRSMFPGSTSSS